MSSPREMMVRMTFYGTIKYLSFDFFTFALWKLPKYSDLWVEEEPSVVTLGMWRTHLRVARSCRRAADSDKMSVWTTVGDTLILMSVPRLANIVSLPVTIFLLESRFRRTDPNNYTPFSSDITRQISHLLACSSRTPRPSLTWVL